MDGVKSEIERKLARARGFMKLRGLDALLYGRADNFAWITAGGDSHCACATDVGVAAVLITRDAQYVITSNIEEDRLKEETLSHLADTGLFEFVSHSWDEELQRTVWGMLRRDDETAYGGEPGVRLGADIPMAGAALVHPEVAHIRMPFTKWEAARYPEIGRGVSHAVERICWRIVPGMTEREIAGMTADELMAAGFTPTVILVGADERVWARRHPLPTGRPLDRYCMIIVCAHSGGMVAAVTRSVHFGPLPDELASAHRAACAVHAEMIAATRAGAAYEDVLDRAVAGYEAHGYPGGWRHHHQGGPIGYQDREFFVAPGRPYGTIGANQAIAWNPSAPGAKSEDTMLVREDGVDIVTAASPDWPMLEIEVDGETVLRPAILVR